VLLSLGPTEKPGRYDAALVIQTNDPQKPTIHVSLSLEVVSAITVRPDSFFFGFVKPGETKIATVTVTAALPFVITSSQADRPELITVETTRQEDGSYQVKATLAAPAEPSTLEGIIQISTDLEEQESVGIPYFVQISAAE